MLKLYIPGVEMFDEKTFEFHSTPGRTLHFEHSLVSLSKWESRWHKSFLSTERKTNEEVWDYLYCMCLDDISPQDVKSFPPEVIDQLNKYISASMTATSIRDEGPNSQQRQIITAEIIYWWMITFGIPFTCEEWHLDRLMTLIRVASIKTAPQKKRTRQEQAAYLEWQREENERRKALYNTKG